MKRRELLMKATAGAAAITWGGRLAVAKEYFPETVDENLFKGINQAKNPAAETGLEKAHWPVIKAPEKVKAGELFSIEVSIGKVLHPMMPEHWIEYVQVNVGNEPAGTLILRSHGFMGPKGTFDLKLGDNLKGKKVSLVVQDKCNLHGLWQNSVNVDVV
jgi:superoxide reductase